MEFAAWEALDELAWAAKSKEAAAWAVYNDNPCEKPTHVYAADRAEWAASYGYLNGIRDAMRSLSGQPPLTIKFRF